MGIKDMKILWLITIIFFISCCIAQTTVQQQTQSYNIPTAKYPISCSNPKNISSCIVSIPQITIPPLTVIPSVDPSQFILKGSKFSFALSGCSVSKDSSGNITLVGTSCTVTVTVVP